MSTLISNPLIIWGYFVTFFTIVGFTVITYLSFQKENMYELPSGEGQADSEASDQE